MSMQKKHQLPCPSRTDRYKRRKSTETRKYECRRFVFVSFHHEFPRKRLPHALLCLYRFWRFCYKTDILSCNVKISVSVITLGSSDPVFIFLKKLVVNLRRSNNCICKDFGEEVARRRLTARDQFVHQAGNEKRLHLKKQEIEVYLSLFKVVGLFGVVLQLFHKDKSQNLRTLRSYDANNN